MTAPAGTRYGVYEIVVPLGTGGMGEVYKARDPRLDRLVALKMLPRDLTNDATARERFEREARTASALNHPNILSVFDVGRDGGAEYLVTELIEGTTLRERLAAGPLPPREVVHLGAQIAEGSASWWRTRRSRRYGRASFISCRTGWRWLTAHGSQDGLGGRQRSAPPRPEILGRSQSHERGTFRRPAVNLRARSSVDA